MPAKSPFWVSVGKIKAVQKSQTQPAQPTHCESQNPEPEKVERAKGIEPSSSALECILFIIIYLQIWYGCVHCSTAHSPAALTLWDLDGLCRPVMPPCIADDLEAGLRDGTAGVFRYQTTAGRRWARFEHLS